MRSQPLVIGRWKGLPELPGLQRLPKVDSNFFGSLNHEIAEKVLAFVVYSCYKMNGPLGWRARFGGHLHRCCS